MLYADMINRGTETAKSVITTSQTPLMMRSKDSENELFKYLLSRADDVSAPRMDIAPGNENKKKAEIELHTLTPPETAEFNQGSKVVYIGLVAAYSDARGNRYYGEECVFWTPSSRTFLYCNGHNQTVTQP